MTAANLHNREGVLRAGAALTISALTTLNNQSGQIVSGNLLTERAPCASCSNVIEQFQAKYPNIKIHVMENGGVISPTKKGP